MLEATELMVGDWVYAQDGEVLVPSKVISINNVGDIKVQGHNPHDDGDAEFLLEDIRPIPLTAEIFKDNGFKDIDSDPFGCNGYNIYYRSGDGWGFNNYDFTLHYVHELQHLLKDCKLFDLADNFKIRLLTKRISFANKN